MCKARAYGARAWLANQQDPGAYGAPGVVERSGVKGTTVVTVTVAKKTSFYAYYLNFSKFIKIYPIFYISLLYSIARK